ncbi:MAG: hypothetical protein IPQ19_13725 [Bacteroidetes bacterium]|nr:hypothetical protein [Bacteroidota bacterium]
MYDVNSVIGEGLNEIKNPKAITAEGILNIENLETTIDEKKLVEEDFGNNSDLDEQKIKLY